MRADKSQIPDGGVGWGDLQVEFETFPAGLDTAPLLKGLPGGACPCPHWGYVFKGRFVVRYADHEETVESGNAFYMAPGHVPVFVEDTEMFELSPAHELRAVLDVVNANAARLDEQLWEQR
jgi:hypothetical protein